MKNDRGRELSVSLLVIFVTRCGLARRRDHVEVPHWNGCGRPWHGRSGRVAARGRGGAPPAPWWAPPGARRVGFGAPAGGPTFRLPRRLSVAGLRHARMASRPTRVLTAALRPQDL